MSIVTLLRADPQCDYRIVLPGVDISQMCPVTVMQAKSSDSSVVGRPISEESSRLGNLDFPLNDVP